MRTFPLALEADGRLCAFEIENAYIGPSTVAKVLRKTKDVTDVEQRRLFSSESEVHIKFTYRGCACIVWEPYGDNSRYWIGPENTSAFEGNVAQVERAFAQYEPPFHRLMIGFILTLRFLRR
jgi:hypothetical protein